MIHPNRTLPNGTRPSRARPARALPLILAASLAGCAAGWQAGGATIVFNDVLHPGYSSAALRSGGAMPLVVLGAPPDGAAPEEVAAAMTLPGRLGGAALTPIAPDRTRTRLTIAFARADPETLCAADSAPPASAAPGAPLEATLALCDGARAQSGAQMRSGATRGPRDAGFRAAILQLYGAALPSWNRSLVRSPGR